MALGMNKKAIRLVYVSNDPAITHAAYSYWRFWYENGATIDFAASPQVNTFKQACRLVSKYFPNAAIVERTANTVWSDLTYDQLDKVA